MDFNASDGDIINISIRQGAVGDLFHYLGNHPTSGHYSLDQIGVPVYNQWGANMSDDYQGFVYDRSNDTLYFDTGSSGFAIAQVHIVGHTALLASSIQLDLLQG